MTFNEKDYKRAWMEDFRKQTTEERDNLRKQKHKEKLLEAGKCPICEIFLHSKYHTDCPFLND